MLLPLLRVLSLLPLLLLAHASAAAAASTPALKRNMLAAVWRNAHLLEAVHPVWHAVKHMDEWLSP